MRLKRLILQGFGRFVGETLDLTPGLNIIFGPNEAGKSTVQRFIVGMLYGQKKRGQRREYSDDAVRSRPWQGDSYRGALLYCLDKTGRTYRIERDFDLGRDEVKIFDDVTGTDLSERYPMDRRKERLFAEAQIGLTEEAFRSTAWVGQLQVGRLELGQDLVTRIGNLRDAGRDDLSVKSAVAFLDEQMREIGSDRAPTRPYARLTRAIEERRQDLQRALAVRAQSQAWEAQLTEARQTLAQIEWEQEAMERALVWALWREGRSRLERISAMIGRSHAVLEQAGELAPFARFGVHLRDRLLRALAESGSAQEHVARQQEQVDRLLTQRDRLGELLDRYPGLAQSGALIADQIATKAQADQLWSVRVPELQAEADRLQEQIAAIDQGLEPLRKTAALGTQVLTQLVDLERERAALAPQASLRRPLQVVGAASAFGTAIWLGVSTSRAQLWGLSSSGGIIMAVTCVIGGIVLLGMAYSGRFGKRRNERYELLSGLGVTSGEEIRNRLVEYETLNTRRDGYQSRLDAIRFEIKRMEDDLAHRRAITASQISVALQMPATDLEAATERFQEQYETYLELHRQAERLERDLGEARRRLRDDQVQADRHRSAAEAILAEAGVADAETFEAGCAKWADHARLVAESASLESAVHAMLEGQAANDLAAEVERLQSALQGQAPVDPSTSQALQSELRRVQGQRAALMAKASDLEARVETTLGDTQDTPDLEREISAMSEERRLMEEELAALELARQVMVSVSTEVHREFAPKLNEAIGCVVSRLTDGRYRTVRIDERLGIRAITSEGRTVELTSLSAGTIDQFYFGLRIALLDLITDPHEPVPLILDDPFVQYDQTRLRASLEYLGQAATQRQIILMTCHQREIHVAQELGLAANLIFLSDETAVD